MSQPCVCHLMFYFKRNVVQPANNSMRQECEKKIKVGYYQKPELIKQIELDAGMWRYHANRMDARRSQFDLGRVVAYI